MIAEAGVADASGVAARPTAKLAAQAHLKDINTVAVAPNDSLIATGSADRTVKVCFAVVVRVRGRLMVDCDRSGRRQTLSW
jgi:hypothetical protein